MTTGLSASVKRKRERKKKKKPTTKFGSFLFQDITFSFFEYQNNWKPEQQYKSRKTLILVICGEKVGNVTRFEYFGSCLQIDGNKVPEIKMEDHTCCLRTKQTITYKMERTNHSMKMKIPETCLCVYSLKWSSTEILWKYHRQQGPKSLKKNKIEERQSFR